jgi:hypothetical protein
MFYLPHLILVWSLLDITGQYSLQNTWLYNIHIFPHTEFPALWGKISKFYIGKSCSVQVLTRTPDILGEVFVVFLSPIRKIQG